MHTKKTIENKCFSNLLIYLFFLTMRRRGIAHTSFEKIVYGLLRSKEIHVCVADFQNTFNKFNILTTIYFVVFRICL